MAQKPSLGKGLASLFPNVPPPAGAPGAGIASPIAPENVSAPTASVVASPQQPSAPVSGESAPSGAVSAGPATPSPSVVLPQPQQPGQRQLGIAMASIEEIRTNTYQPRHDFDEAAIEELAQSIRANGLIQPLVVRKGAVAGYELIAGERRLRAARAAGLRQVPIVIRRSTDREALELAIVENIQRRDLNAIEEALAFQQLIDDFALTQEEVARRVGKDRASVANHLRLLKLSDAVQSSIRSGKLSLGHAKVILGVPSLEDQNALAQMVMAEKLSVRETEALVQSGAAAKAANTAPGAATTATSAAAQTPVRQRLNAVSQDLTRRWSTRVQIKGNERRGKIVVEYSSRSELERLLAGMQNQSIWPAP